MESVANPNPSPRTRFQPGQSANPGGRPKQTVSARLRELLDERAGKPTKVQTKRDEIALAIFEEALARDHKFIETLLERTEGKVPIAVQQTTLTPDVVKDAHRKANDRRNARSTDGSSS
jgi:hypothetical protein